MVCVARKRVSNHCTHDTAKRNNRLSNINKIDMFEERRSTGPLGYF